MASFTKEHEIVFSVTCGTCGTELECSEYEYRGSLELKVEPCDKCIDEKDQEIEDLKETYEEQLEELQDEIDAMKTELTYNKLKNKEPELTNVSNF